MWAQSEYCRYRNPHSPGRLANSLARTFASRLTRSGVDIVTVKELLGHASINCTLRSAHSNDAAKRRAVDKRGTGDKVVTTVPRRAKVAV